MSRGCTGLRVEDPKPSRGGQGMSSLCAMGCPMETVTRRSRNALEADALSSADPVESRAYARRACAGRQPVWRSSESAFG